MEKLIDFESYPIKTALKVLLQDKTTKKNIIWATDSYASFGEAYTDRSQITESQLTNANYGMIQPRISKDVEQQTRRTRKSAEVWCRLYDWRRDNLVLFISLKKRKCH